MAQLKQTSHEMGMHAEQLAGRTQQIFFSSAEEENFTYPTSYEVDFDQQAEFDAADMDIMSINTKIRGLMQKGCGTITVKNPGAKHSLGVGILNRLNLVFEGSLGYYGCGLIDGPNVRIKGRVGWSCAENMMSLWKRMQVRRSGQHSGVEIWYAGVMQGAAPGSTRKAAPSL